jgi:hypothetical protein
MLGTHAKGLKIPVRELQWGDCVPGALIVERRNQASQPLFRTWVDDG